MKGRVIAARKKLTHIVARADKLGVDLNCSASARSLRNTCSETESSISSCILLLGLVLLAFVLSVSFGHRFSRLQTSHCSSNQLQELHIQTLSWRLPPDEGVESQQHPLANWSSLRMDDCQDRGRVYGK